MKAFQKLLEKKKDGGKELDPLYKDAKMSTLKALRGEMVDMMKGDLAKPGMKKVEVAANDEEGLAAGLDKAKDIVEGDDDLGDFESPKSEELAEESEESNEVELSDEEIAQLEALLAKAKKMKV
jgi:hypothetical protein